MEKKEHKTAQSVQDMLKKYQKLGYPLFALYFLLLAGLSETTVVTGDASFHLVSAKFIADHGRLPLFEPVYEPIFWYPPLFHILIAAVYRLFSIAGEGAAQFAILLVNPILAAASLLVGYEITKRLFGGKTAVYAAAFLAFLPIFFGLGSRPTVDMLMMLLLLLSIKYALLNRPIQSGIFAGLGLLTKYHALFIFPTLLFIFWTTTREKLGNTLKFTASAGMVGIWWFLRNWIVLGNPIYHFLPNIFGGEYRILREKTFMFGGIDNLIGSAKGFVLETLELSAITPGIRTAALGLVLMYLATLAIAAFGFLKSIPRFKHRNFVILNLLLVSQAAVSLLCYLGVGGLGARLVLLLFFAVAIYFGLGVAKLDGLLQSRRYLRPAFLLSLFLIFAGFSVAMAIKGAMVNEKWGTWQDDISWAKTNTGKDAFFVVMGIDSLGWQVQRDSFTLEEELVWINTTAYAKDWINPKEVDYLFVTRSPKSGATPAGDINITFYRYFEEYPALEVAYQNPESQTTIYRFKKA